jgi:hypothetical protein
MAIEIGDNVHGDSYQKQQYDKATLDGIVYQEIPTGDFGVIHGVKNKKTWVVGLVMFAVLGMVYGVTMQRHHAATNTGVWSDDSNYSNNKTYPYVNVAMIGNSMMYYNDLPRLTGAC